MCDECSICCEAFNRSTRLPVVCTACEARVCRVCVKQYISTLTEETKCMLCDHVWSRQFLAESMPKTFMTNEYKWHREALLLDREKSTLPAAQPYAAATRRLDELRDRVKEIRKREDEIKREKYHTERAIRAHTNFLDGFTDHVTVAGREIRSVMTFETRGHCPRDGCNGFIEGGWKCGVCATKICSRCMVVKSDDEHICDELALASVEAIRKDSRPCPSCRVRVYRISGCSQMWCTNCNTAFSWTTMKIINVRHFHNPHYAQWVANGGRPVENVGNAGNGGAPVQGGGCDGELYGGGMYIATHNGIIERIKAIYNTNYIYANRNTPAHRHYDRYSNFLNRLNDRAARYLTVPDNRETAFRGPKVAYLLGKMDMDGMKIELQRIDKRESLKMEVRQILSMYTRVCRDCIAGWCSGDIDDAEFDDRCGQIYKFTTDALKSTKSWYNSNSNAYADIITRPPAPFEAILTGNNEVL